MMKGRRADTTLWGILVRVLAVIAVITLVFMFADKIWAAIKPLSYDDYAKQQFDILAQDVEDLLEDGKTFSTSTSLYSFHKDFTVVGFDHDWMDKISIKPQSTKDERGPVVKPDACYEEREGQKMERACLCLYKGNIREIDAKDNRQAVGGAEGYKYKNRNVIKCKTYRGDVVFLGKLHDKSVEKREGYIEESRGVDREAFPYETSEEHPNYEYLFLYSEKNNAFWDLYLEKYRKEGKIYVYITKNFPEYIHMFDFFHPCPEGSDKLCVGKQFDQTVSVTEAIREDPSLPAPDPGIMNFVCHYYEEDGVCKYKAYGNCPIEIYEPCMCEGQIYFTGICVDDKYVTEEKECTQIKECKDYCEHEACTNAEAALCKLDLCGRSCVIETEEKGAAGARIEIKKCVLRVTP